MIMAQSGGSGQPLPLSEAAEGQSRRVDRVEGPDRLRLSEMGLVPGAEITVLRHFSRDRLMVRLGGCRLALARETTGRVWVS